MSQQINLLADGRQGVSPIVVALSAWGLVLLMVFVAWGVNQFRLSDAREAEASAAREVQEGRAMIDKRDETKRGLDQEIAALRPVATAAGQLLTLAEGVGTPDGYIEQFALLAAATEPNLWVDSIRIERSGKSINVEGVALTNEAIMRFGQALNAAFAERGVQFTSVELQPLQAQGGAAASSSTPAVPATRFVFR